MPKLLETVLDLPHRVEKAAMPASAMCFSRFGGRGGEA
jgi:hypothetical protein